MSNLNESQVPESNTDITNQSEKEIVVELGNMTDNQKLVFLITLGSFLVQIFYITNLQIVTGLFKSFIALSYNPVADYIVQFIHPAVPYILALYFGFLIFFIYVVLVYDPEDLLSLGELFDYSVVGIIFFMVLFFISVFSLPTLPITPFYPNAVEFLLFIVVICISLTIALAPFGFYKYAVTEDHETGNRQQHSEDDNL